MYHLLAVAVAIAAAPAAAADVGAQKVDPLQLRPKAGVVALAPSHNNAPFVTALNQHAEPPNLSGQHDQRLDQSRSSCSSERSLCYDQDSGRIVYKPARNLMPDLPGLTRENISVKRDRIIFRYSF
jgi:hypothetical protein